MKFDPYQDFIAPIPNGELYTKLIEFENNRSNGQYADGSATIQYRPKLVEAFVSNCTISADADTSNSWKAKVNALSGPALISEIADRIANVDDSDVGKKGTLPHLRPWLIKNESSVKTVGDVTWSVDFLAVNAYLRRSVLEQFIRAKFSNSTDHYVVRHAIRLITILEKKGKLEERTVSFRYIFTITSTNPGEFKARKGISSQGKGSPCDFNRITPKFFDRSTRST